MSKGQHWTERSTEDFVQRIAFDFTTQIEKLLESGNSSQAALAKSLGLTEGRVSQILNNPGNLGLKNVVRFARAIGRKVALVLYDDGDPMNTNGPVNSEIFSTCWERAGRPADFWALQRENLSIEMQASYEVVSSASYGFVSSSHNVRLSYQQGPSMLLSNPASFFWGNSAISSTLGNCFQGGPMAAPLNDQQDTATTGGQRLLQ